MKNKLKISFSYYFCIPNYKKQMKYENLIIFYYL